MNSTLGTETTETNETNEKFLFSDSSFEFIFDPFLTADGLDFFKNTQNNENTAFVYISFGLEYAQKFPDKYQSEFQKAVKDLASVLEKNDVKVFIAPVFTPFFEKLSGKSSEDFSTVRLETLNNILINAFPTSNNILITQVFNLLAEGRGDYYDKEGVHYIDQIYNLQADILYNMVCNTKVSTSYPFAKTCCLNYPKPAGTYLFVFLLTVAFIPVIMIGNYLLKGWGSKVSNGNPKAKITWQNVQGAFMIFSLCLAYGFFCDRTQIFSKGNKNFKWSEFSGLCIISLLFGSFTSIKIANPKNATFLNRFQTDEWKGWMQIAILIYHITGGSKVLPIYKAIRVMVASYLFMTGYGHTVFFTKKADFGLKRVVSVLCRLNMLTIFLAYVMNTDYLFYYFSPLVTFWFGIVWLTYRIFPQYNIGLKSSLIKVTISGIFVYFFISIPGPLEAIFWVLEKLARISWNLREWRFRVMLDIWAVHAGMITSILVNNDELHDFRSKLLKFRHLGLVIGSVLLVSYWVLSGRYEEKTEYNKVNKYLSILPIIGFVLVRNTPSLINFYSRGFAWFGKVSLETFILQFHIWMAADTKGILYMIDMGLHNNKYNTTNSYIELVHSYEIRHFVNFFFISVPFLLLSERVSYASGILTSFFINPKDVFELESSENSNTIAEPIPLNNLAEERLEDKESVIGLDNIHATSYSNSTFVRLLQKLWVVLSALLLNLKFRLVFILSILLIINLLW